MQADAFADDVPILDEMKTWSREAVHGYFESGGERVPVPVPSSRNVSRLHQGPQKPGPSSSASTVTSTMQGVHLPDVEVLSSRVTCVRGLNAGHFTGPGTNTYIVGKGTVRALIDAGDAGRPDYVSLLRRALVEKCAGATLSRILITHSHPDHIGGAAAVAAACGAEGGVSFLKVPWAGHDCGLPIAIVSDGQVVRVDESTTLRAYVTPGHAPDHVCWGLEEEGVLFSGDNVLGAGTVVVPHHGGSMRDYLHSLRRLSKTPWAAIYPGHGPPIAAARQALLDYITHREQREAQIVEQLRPDGAGVTAAELVNVLYRDRPMPWVLKAAAAETVFNHLLFLREQGRADSLSTQGPTAVLGSRWVLATA